MKAAVIQSVVTILQVGVIAVRLRVERSEVLFIDLLVVRLGAALRRPRRVVVRRVLYAFCLACTGERAVRLQ